MDLFDMMDSDNLFKNDILPEFCTSGALDMYLSPSPDTLGVFE